MTRRTRTIWVVVALTALVLGVPRASGAACAWLLWLEEKNWGHIGKLHEWEILAVHDARDACALDLKDRLTKLAAHTRQRVAERPARKRLTITEDAVSTQFLLTDEKVPSGGMTIRFRCLPDTIDPRGPKGAP
jgi:hypothetical protein